MNLFDQNIQKLRIIWEHKVPYDARPKITSSGDVYEVFIQAFDEGTIDYKEFFYVMLLNRANKVLAIHKISEGGLSGTVADPKVIFQTALLAKATSLILCHNHPSGNIKPSDADIRLTQKLKNAGEFLDIPVLDHLIITQERYFSFADEGEI